MTERLRKPEELLSWLIAELTPCTKVPETTMDPFFRHLSQGPRSRIPGMLPMLADRFVPAQIKSELRQHDKSVLTDTGALAVVLSEHPDSDPTVLSLVMVAVVSSLR